MKRERRTQLKLRTCGVTCGDGLTLLRLQPTRSVEKISKPDCSLGCGLTVPLRSAEAVEWAELLPYLSTNPRRFPIARKTNAAVSYYRAAKSSVCSWRYRRVFVFCALVCVTAPTACLISIHVPLFCKVESALLIAVFLGTCLIALLHVVGPPSVNHFRNPARSCSCCPVAGLRRCLPIACLALFRLPSPPLAFVAHRDTWCRHCSACFAGLPSSSSNRR